VSLLESGLTVEMKVNSDSRRNTIFSPRMKNTLVKSGLRAARGKID
jgi:hypothetical protein